MNSHITLSQHQQMSTHSQSGLVQMHPFLTPSTVNTLPYCKHYAPILLIYFKMFLILVPEVHRSNSVYRPETFMTFSLHLRILSSLSEKDVKSKLQLLIVIK